jgi:hypothetical protein
VSAPAEELTIAQWLRVHVYGDREYQDAAKRVRKAAFGHYRTSEMSDDERTISATSTKR